MRSTGWEWNGPWTAIWSFRGISLNIRFYNPKYKYYDQLYHSESANNSSNENGMPFEYDLDSQFGGVSLSVDKGYRYNKNTSVRDEVSSSVRMRSRGRHGSPLALQPKARVHFQYRRKPQALYAQANLEFGMLRGNAGANMLKPTSRPQGMRSSKVSPYRHRQPAATNSFWHG